MKKLPTTHYKLQTNSGFGVLEALIASGIIAIFAGGVVILGNMALRSVVINKHRLQAAYLAQEAVELVKNIRDSNWVDANPNNQWDDGITDSSVNGAKLTYDELDKKWKLESGPKAIPLNEVSFTREIRITKAAPTETDPLKKRTADIEVKVSWQDYGKEKEVIINSIITDWMIY